MALLCWKRPFHKSWSPVTHKALHILSHPHPSPLHFFPLPCMFPWLTHTGLNSYSNSPNALQCRGPVAWATLKALTPEICRLTALSFVWFLLNWLSNIHISLKYLPFTFLFPEHLLTSHNISRLCQLKDRNTLCPWLYSQLLEKRSINMC